MTERTPPTIHRLDYRRPDYLVDSVDLFFDLDETETRVRSRLSVRAVEPGAGHPLVLDGRDLQLEEILIDNLPLDPEAYRLDEERLTVFAVPAACTVETLVRIRPAANTSLEGLYLSGGLLTTQCEAEGFRKITYFPDRPDVLARYTVTIEADGEKYPVLLSNGNLVAEEELANNRRRVRWQDPFPKPSYLFALVAGRLACLRDEFVTASGRTVQLAIYADARHIGACGHAMASLKQAMRWDEERYGLECDLDTYMIVAVSDFNMGAMENKGLNVFNASRLLARPETATDADYQGIEAVVAHEYFHNWTGNRVTCRDWFQLSLKEGLTVFRDQQFSAERVTGPLQRIRDVQLLRGTQFPEDAGPMAHPVRPDSYIEINNFYTMTVYYKGAEVVRMLHNLLGEAGFRRGMDLYFRRHDGEAVTCDDFVAAMEAANGVDLGQFRRWYEQAGTPELEVVTDWDAAAGAFSLSLRQSCAATPGQEKKKNFLIPLALGLLDRKGRELPLRLVGEAAPWPATTRVLELRETAETYTFVGLEEEPVPSLLRGFSAPVKLRLPRSERDLAFLAAHDPDPFNRWEGMQQLMMGAILGLVEQAEEETTSLDLLIEAMGGILSLSALDHGFAALCLALPSETYLGEQQKIIDVDGIHHARQRLRKTVARRLAAPLRAVAAANFASEPYRYDSREAGRRSLRNTCLAYLAVGGEAADLALCLQQFEGADNMTDQLGALAALAGCQGPQRQTALAAFYERWLHEPLVVDKWLAVQAASSLPGTLAEVERLTTHPSFEPRNPNKVRALLGTFAAANPFHFHDSSGRGYRFLADWILRLDKMNPHTAARLAGSLSRWRRYDQGRRALMRAELERLAAARLSPATYEIVSKSLAAPGGQKE